MMILTFFPMIFVLTGILSAIFIFIDIYLLGNRQSMGVMNLVWVLTALWGGIVGLLAYFSFGRKKKDAMAMPMDMKMKMDVNMKMDNMNMSHDSKPKWETTALSTLHCGAGCTLADLIGEWFIFFFPMAILSGWILDYILALFIGILFQYAVIRGMGVISKKEAYKKAIKADFWSLTAWQVGMYGFLAIAIWVFGVELHRLSWQFWSLMQFAMVCGFLVSFPVNRILIKRGIKKGM